MEHPLNLLFEDQNIIRKIQRRLPYLFQLAEVESSRAGKTGMEAGSVREKIIIALLIYKFGEENVDTNLPITNPEADVILFNLPISIKTISGNKLSGIKLIWTVDPQKAKEFQQNYYPSCDIILVQINWGHNGGLFHIPLDNQIAIFKELGKENYIKLPKPGTNPRGIELSLNAMNKLINRNGSKYIPIEWKKHEIKINPYKRWVELWKED
ncbi:MAG: ThaI family type II restriction endonuclease [Candidatus Aminicenantes bacterium]|nr:ThaI family type II restriction endonuclease [Candidatus Aminicenantes bacterium]